MKQRSWNTPVSFVPAGTFDITVIVLPHFGQVALACIDFTEYAGGLVTPIVEATMPVERESLFQCEHFQLWRLRGQSPFTVGAVGVPRVLVCIEGAGQVEHSGATYAVGKGDVVVLPAVVGACAFQPRSAVNLLEIALPE